MYHKPINLESRRKSNKWRENKFLRNKKKKTFEQIKAAVTNKIRRRNKKIISRRINFEINCGLQKQQIKINARGSIWARWSIYELHKK